MRILIILTGLLCATVASAWSPEDHEIFRLRDDVIAHEGANTTFYSFLGVQRKATLDDVNRAYRKRAARLHPDKARQAFISSYAKTAKDKAKKHPSKREIDAFSKEASERFARLGVIANIIRGPSRERYDFFLDHGFPKWRGTGYYYQRYRPGAGTVLVGLLIAIGGFAHYGALVLSWKRQRSFAQKYIIDARKMAWGKDMVVPGLDTAAPVAAAATNGNGASSALNRRQKRMQEKENKKNAKKGITTEEVSEPQEATLISGPQGGKKKVVAENGKVLIVDSVGNVFLEETTAEGDVHEYLIDINEISKPTIKDTVLFRLPIAAFNAISARISGKVDPPSLDESETDEGSFDPVLSSATAINANHEAKRRSKAKVRQRT